MNKYRITIYTRVTFKWNELHCRYNQDGDIQVQFDNNNWGQDIAPYFVRIYE